MIAPYCLDSRELVVFVEVTQRDRKTIWFCTIQSRDVDVSRHRRILLDRVATSYQSLKCLQNLWHLLKVGDKILIGIVLILFKKCSPSLQLVQWKIAEVLDIVVAVFLSHRDVLDIV